MPTLFYFVSVLFDTNKSLIGFVLFLILSTLDFALSQIFLFV